MGRGDIVSLIVDEREHIINCYSAKKCFLNLLFSCRFYAYMVENSKSWYTFSTTLKGVLIHPDRLKKNMCVFIRLQNYYAYNFRA